MQQEECNRRNAGVGGGDREQLGFASCGAVLVDVCFGGALVCGRLLDILRHSYQGTPLSRRCTRPRAGYSTEQKPQASMPHTPESVSELLQRGLGEDAAPVVLEVEDLSDGCGAKFSILCVSAAFEGRSIVEKHQLVHAALGSAMDEIHAVEIKAYSPAQWEKKQQKAKA